MKHDNSYLLSLQDKYKHNQIDYIDEYFSVLKEIATYQIVYLLGRSSYGLKNYPQDRIDEIATDATLRFLGMYEDPLWRWNGNIANRLIMDVRHLMYGPKTIQSEQVVSIDDHINDAIQPAHELSSDPILDLDKVDLYHLAVNQYYKRAILAIAAVKGKEYCYEKCQSLRYVFLILKKGNESHEKKKKTKDSNIVVDRGRASRRNKNNSCTK